MRPMATMKRMIRDQAGATMVEYGLIMALIVAGLIAGLQVTGTSVLAMWSDVEAKITAST